MQLFIMRVRNIHAAEAFSLGGEIFGPCAPQMYLARHFWSLSDGSVHRKLHISLSSGLSDCILMSPILAIYDFKYGFFKLRMFFSLQIGLIHMNNNMNKKMFHFISVFLH